MCGFDGTIGRHLQVRTVVTLTFRLVSPVRGGVLDPIAPAQQSCLIK